ncbi:hypothetical protein GN244_ATG12212 [Phytophthora infestans]|uniref:Uncharacterized protein n=1 Tax=Phytophthora infestans TaxID=4787 RepID=A0A833SLV9_PHYIN|nr:hypothetical protein GN244_ATG12212 [Phytophthora infestans]
MRRDDFALKTNHCVAFVKEEYSSWASDYLLTRQEDSLRRAIRRVALSRGFSFRRATKTIISTQELLAEQQRFSAEVGAEIKKAYQRECVFNADETAVYYEEDPGIIACRARPKQVRAGQRTPPFGSSECAAHRFRGRKKAKAASHFPRPARRHN